MLRIVHLSDTHFGTEIDYLLDAARNSIAVLAPDVIVVAGDVTHRARTSQFRRAVQFLGRFAGIPSVVVPGNHDIPLFNAVARAFFPYGAYMRHLGARETSWPAFDGTVIGFDSTTPWRHTRGELDRARLEARVRSARAQGEQEGLLIVAMHHPLFTAWPEDRHEVLIDVENAAGVLSELGVDLVLSGHVHVPVAITTREPFPDLPRHFVLAGAGTAISRRTRPGAPNSFNLIEAQRGSDGRCRMAITQYRYEEAFHRFIAYGVVRYASAQAGGWYPEGGTAGR